MEQKIETKIVGRYNGHAIKANQSVDIVFKCAYDQLTNYIRLIQFLNIDTSVDVKLSGEKPFSLGVFRVKEIKVDHDGEGVVRLNSMADFVNTDSINKLVGSELVALRCSATAEIEGDIEQELEA